MQWIQIIFEGAILIFLRLHFQQFIVYDCSISLNNWKKNFLWKTALVKKNIGCSFKNDFNQLWNARRLKCIGINFAIIISKLTIWVYTFLLFIHRYILFFWFWGLFKCFVHARFFLSSYKSMFFYSYLGGIWKNLPIILRQSTG